MGGDGIAEHWDYGLEKVIGSGNGTRCLHLKSRCQVVSKENSFHLLCHESRSLILFCFGIKMAKSPHSMRVKVCSAILGLFAVGPIAGADDIDLNTAMTLFQEAGKAVRSYDLYIAFKYSAFLRNEVVSSDPSNKVKKPLGALRSLQPGEEPKTQLGITRQVYQAAKWRHEKLDDASKPLHILVCDGEMERSLDIPSAGGYFRKPSLAAVSEGIEYLEFIKNAYGKADLHRILRQRRNTRLVVGKNAETSEVIIQTDPENGDDYDMPKWGFRVHLDLQKDCMPRQIERFIVLENGSEFVERTTSIKTYIKLSEGLWVPTEGITSIFSNAEGPTKGHMAAQIITTVDVSRSKWNLPIDENMFDLSFPTGTKIVDKIRNVVFVTGNSQPESNMKELIKSAKNVLRLTEAAPTVPNNTATIVLLFIAVVLASVLCVFYVKHKLRRQRG
jgi:hypothetical protein